ncbi:hypothetical protein B0A55_11917 [Friedmanniomyces simplex]|uniref:Uncharacterized protein n=1 Tax=Friedmanniomyces simplex TaxID=329884 RepID=A0A4U0WMQ7_9PEZI|nr:hypothetical protein B0A55_11917 [Friedmanniomyces simplex]
MAALLITAGLAIADKIDRKKQACKDKKALDEQRYRELQAETKGTMTTTATTTTPAGRRSSGGEGSDSDVEGGESAQRRVRGGGDGDGLRAPPSYEEAVGHGGRRPR